MESFHPMDAKRGKPMKLLNSGYEMGLLRVPSHVADYWRSEVPQSVVGILEADSKGKERLMIPNIESYEGGGSSGQHPDSIGSVLRPSLFDGLQDNDGSHNKPTDSITVNNKTRNPSARSTRPNGNDGNNSFQYLDIAPSATEASALFFLSHNTLDDSSDTEAADDNSLEVLGKVSKCTSVIPKFDGSYKTLWRSKFHKMQVKDHQTALAPTADFQSRPQGSTDAFLFRYYNESSAVGGNRLATSSAPVPKSRAKRARVDVTMTFDELQRVVFQIMGDSPEEGVSLTELLRKTGQPQSSVKQVVEKICDFRRHKYSLKQQFSSSRLT